MYKKTLLVNQNGDEFIGWSDNEFNPTTGELIFNTAMTGFVKCLEKFKSPRTSLTSPDD